MDQHNTHVEEIYPTGAERWLCATCGREVIWQFPPALKLKNIVLVEGNSSVCHKGVKQAEGLEIDMDADIDDEIFPADLKEEIEDVLGDIE